MSTFAAIVACRAKAERGQRNNIAAQTSSVSANLRYSNRPTLSAHATEGGRAEEPMTEMAVE
ncbi:MAG: hypothetical protein KatS3mg015_0044 [Fimbriimonadales bacterium]|nr:MAG: hypothetical protein KatS3mg015_0044 [Fimbriimonadales bacterium]